MMLARLLVALQLAGDEPRLAAILERLSEEAEVFAYQAPKAIGRETLTHRGTLPLRYRLRIGPAAERPPERRVTRQLVSEYAFGAFEDSPGEIREFRRVLSVDGRKVRAKGDPKRTTLASQLGSADDQRRRKLLEDFQRDYGTLGAVTDFGQVLLLFRRASLDSYGFELQSGAGADVALSFRQKSGPAAVRIFQTKGERAARPMEGMVWIKREGLLPDRVVIEANDTENLEDVTHRAEVIYELSRHGVLLPARVAYTKTAGGKLLIENVARYDEYKMFGADTEIKFETADDVPPPKP